MQANTGGLDVEQGTLQSGSKDRGAAGGMSELDVDPYDVITRWSEEDWLSRGAEQR